MTFTLYDYIDLELGVRKPNGDEAGKRHIGRDWPLIAESMIGTTRMLNVQECLTNTLTDGIPGDVIECGVWRGGTSIFMKGILKAYDSQKMLYVADSFQGLPAPNPEKYPMDRGCDLHTHNKYLACSEKDVRGNFERYGLLDEKVTFVKGWFKDTLSSLKNAWSLIRLDGDMYESITQSLEFLYPQLQSGGYLLVDDYGAMRQTRQATDDYRAKNDITEPIKIVDWAGAWWRKN